MRQTDLRCGHQRSAVTPDERAPGEALVACNFYHEEKRTTRSETEAHLEPTTARLDVFMISSNLEKQTKRRVIRRPSVHWEPINARTYQTASVSSDSELAGLYKGTKREKFNSTLPLPFLIKISYLLLCDLSDVYAMR